MEIHKGAIFNRFCRSVAEGGFKVERINLVSGNSTRLPDLAGRKSKNRDYVFGEALQKDLN
jgi:hypothetical protein